MQFFLLAATVVLCTAGNEDAFLQKKSGKTTSQAVVKIPELGKVTGNLLTSGVSEFISIPYGNVPMRFSQSVAKTHWPAGEIDARGPGIGCLQFARVPYEQQSEDCLYLNIWAPPAAKASLPVWFWIHGGGLIRGAGYLNNGSSLSQRADIVVVTPNYRLGALGFYASTELKAESKNSTGGMNGMLDQLLALKWVKEHIAHFGGDPDRIFIGGESGGSQSTCFHAFSNLTAELGLAGFVHQSGSCVGPWGPSSQADGLQDSREWMKSIERIPGFNIDANSVLKSLRTLSSAAFNGDSAAHITETDAYGYSCCGPASIDGHFLDKLPSHSQLTVARETPVILGLNDMDGLMPLVWYDSQSVPPESESEIIHMMTRDGLSKRSSESVVEFYRSKHPSPPVRGWMNSQSNSSSSSWAKLYWQIHRDASLTCPLKWLAEKFVNERQSKAYLYWEYFPNSSLTYHGADISLIFGRHHSLPYHLPHFPQTLEYDEAIDRTGLLFRQFFHGMMSETDWESYDPKKANYMNLTFSPHMADEHGYSDVACDFWYKLRDESVNSQDEYLSFGWLA